MGNKPRLQNAVEITNLVETGAIKIHDSGKWRYYYEEALNKAGAEYGISCWSLPGYEEEYDDVQEACEAFSLPVRREECKRFFLVDADFAQDLFGHEETVITPGGVFKDLCLWCRPPVATNGTENWLEIELEIELVNPFE